MKTVMDEALLGKNSNIPKIQKAFDLFKSKKFKEALEVFRDLYSKDTTNYEYNYYVGLTYANLGYFDVALNHLLYSSKTNRNYYISIHSSMICGYIYTLREEYKLAENCFREVLKINPQSVSAMIAIAYVFEKTNRYDQSIIYLKKALELDPENPRALNALSYIYAEREINITDAVKLARKAVSYQPDSPETRDTLAWAYYKKGEYVQAMNEIKKAMELLPNNEEILKHYKEISSKLEEIKSRTK